MSQIIKDLSAGPVPPTVATSYETQDGTAVPAANILIVNAYDTTEDNVNGIETKGGAAGGDPPGGGAVNEVDVYLTNRLQDSGQTVGAVTSDLVTFSLGSTPATYVIQANFCAFESTTAPSGAGAGYSLFGTVRTTGGGVPTAALVGTPDKINNEDTALENCTADIIAFGNSVILRVTGTEGLTVRWSVVGYYVRVV